MSSTQRGTTRHPDDFYETPAETTRALVGVIPLTAPVLDAGCGTGAISRVLKRSGRIDRGWMMGVENHPGRAESTFPC